MLLLQLMPDVVAVACRSDATYDELASELGISVSRLCRWVKQADVAAYQATGLSDYGPGGVVA